MVRIAKEEKVLPGSMMDFGMGNSVPQEKDFQSLGSWIPATPAKPTPVRPKPISGDNQGNQLGGSNWLGLMEFQSGRSQETPTTRGSGMAAHFWPSGPVDLNKGPDNWELPPDWRNRDSIHPVRSHAESFRATTAEWNNIAFADLLAAANRASPSAYSNTYVRGDSLSSSSYRWIDSSQQVSSSASLLLRSQHLNRQQQNSSSSLVGGQDLSFGSNQRIACNYPSQTHQYGFPVPYHLTYDLNAPPRIATDVGSNGTISSQPAPAPQNQASKIDESQVLEKSNLGVATRQNQEKSDKDAIAPGVDEGNKHRCDEKLSQLVDSSSAATLTPGDENHKPDQEGEHGIDLNKTPQQKTRRRKYTPKVVTEGKPKRTHNPATPKTKENPSGKRKYVRRKGLNVTDPPLYNAMQKVIDPNVGNDRKSCKRSLNFDLEAHAIEENNGTTVRHLEGIQVQCSSLDNASCSRTFNFNSGSEANDLCTTNVDIPGRKSTIQLRQGMQLTVEKTQAAGSYDLRQSMSQILADYMSLPEIVDYINPPARIEDPPRENLEALVRNENETEARGACQNSGENGCLHQQVHVDRIGSAFPAKDSVVKHDSTIQTMLQRCSQAAPNSQNDTNCYVNAPFSEEEQARGPKKDYCHATGQPHCNLNPFGAHYNPLQAYQDTFQANDSNSNRATCNPYFPQIFKKKRTERGQTAITSCMSSSTTAVEDGSGGTKACSRNVINFHPCLVSDSQATLHKPQLSECMMKISHMRRTTKKRSKGFTRVRDSASLKAIANCNQLPPTHHKKTPPSSNGQGTEISHGTQACMNALLADNLAKTTTKKRTTTKKGPPDSSILSGNMNAWHVQEHENFMYDYHQSSAQARSSSLGQKAIKSSTRTSLVFHINPHQRSIANFRRSFESDPMEQLQKHLTPIDEIVEKLECLDINGGGGKISRKYQNALVPYSGDRTMVPYEGPFDPMKKRRPRPKVDLDPETNRVWKLLMGKEASEGIEETDQDKEKWWEDERMVFSGRTASFVARMRLVQGDRRFSPWKGSVVDSVIGVFLTQNVSDHLSSSAFMSLAARFPLKSRTNNRTHDGETIISVEDPEVCIADTIEWHEKISSRLPYDQSSVTFHEPDHTDEREVANSQESFGSNIEGLTSAENSKSKLLLFCESGLEMSNGSQEKRTETSNVGTESTSFAETGYRKGVEDVSSQNSVVSPQRSIESPVIQTAERFGSCSESNSEAEDLTVGFKTNNMESSGSFMELLQMAGNTISHERYGHGNENLSLNESSSSGQKHLDEMQSNKQRSCLNKLDLLKGSSASTYKSDPLHSHIEDPVIPSSNYCSHMTRDFGDLEVECFGAFRQESQSYLPSNASEVTDSKDTGCMNKQIGWMAESVCEAPVQQKVMPSARKTAEVDPYASLTRHQKHPACNSQKDTHTEKNPNSCSNCKDQITKVFQSEETMGADLMQNSRNNGCRSAETLGVVETNPLSDKQESSGSTRDESNEDQMHSIGMKLNGKNTTDNKKAKRRSFNADKNKGIDWDNLRKQASADGRTKERSNNTLDSVDWEAVRCADVGEISKAIKERGMNNMLAERIKDFLNRLVRDHGSIDLEWLRDVPPEKTKEYLLSVRGLGLKSVECVRLLTLHHLAFPVDTNVGRIAVRLGWVPLQPLPESLQLHLLEMYPVLESIQKYLWPRLCTLDQHSLYELHYQMITFGKVFCTKSKPNCNACPMRGECRHFASAFASARLPLPGPEEKSIVSSVPPGQDPRMVVNPLPLPLPESNPFSEAISRISNYEPIVEIPATPEPEYTEITEADIEDAFWEDPDEIPTIKLNIEEFTQNLQNYMQQNNMELQEGGMSKALVALTPEAASIPTPKLKNVSRLRTEHQVYELPDGHSLLEGLDAREPDDPCSYLLAIWTPGETANSIEPPEKRCGSQESGGLCNDKTCFSCNSIREADSQTVRGTLLIPCRTAMRGSFPLNGTYFQVNEVFADHDSSVSPIEVPRTLIWNLPRRIVYFGTSVPTIFKGLQTEDIQKCFWKGFVCVRGFDQKTRAPRPLMARLHFPASKLTQTKARKTNEDMMARKGT